MTRSGAAKGILWSEYFVKTGETLDEEADALSARFDLKVSGLDDMNEAVVGYRVLHTDGVDADLLLLRRDIQGDHLLIELDAGLGKVSAAESAALHRQVLHGLTDEPTANDLVAIASAATEQAKPSNESNLPVRRTPNRAAVWASGADRRVVLGGSLPSVSFESTGSLVTLLSLFEGASIGYALALAGFSSLFATVSGVTFAFVIFAMSRTLTFTVASGNSRRLATFALALPRILILSLISVISSQAVLFAVFSKELAPSQGGGILELSISLGRLAQQSGYARITQILLMLLIFAIQIYPIVFWATTRAGAVYRRTQANIEREWQREADIEQLRLDFARKLGALSSARSSVAEIAVFNGIPDLQPIVDAESELLYRYAITVTGASGPTPFSIQPTRQDTGRTPTHL